MWHPLVKYIIWESYNELLSQIEPFFQRLLDNRMTVYIVTKLFTEDGIPSALLIEEKMPHFDQTIMI